MSRAGGGCWGGWLPCGGGAAVAALRGGEGVPSAGQWWPQGRAQAWAWALVRTPPSAHGRWGRLLLPGAWASELPRAQGPGMTPRVRGEACTSSASSREGAAAWGPRGGAAPPGPPARAPAPRWQGHGPAPPASAGRAGPRKPQAVWGGLAPGEGHGPCGSRGTPRACGSLTSAGGPLPCSGLSCDHTRCLWVGCPAGLLLLNPATWDLEAALWYQGEHIPGEARPASLGRAGTVCGHRARPRNRRTRRVVPNDGRPARAAGHLVWLSRRDTT